MMNSVILPAHFITATLRATSAPNNGQLSARGAPTPQPSEAPSKGVAARFWRLSALSRATDGRTSVENAEYMASCKEMRMPCCRRPH